MFVRTKTTQGRTYIQIVESYREKGKVRQKVIATLGRIDKLKEKGQIENVLRSLARFSEKVMVKEKYQRGKLEAQKVTRIGPDLILRRLWKELGIDKIIKNLTKDRKYGFSLEKAVYLSSLSRLFFPGSDRKATRLQRDYQAEGAESLELHHLYRAMAWLGENREKIEEALFFRNRDLFTSLSMVFFDTTTLYFEGKGGENLGRKGYSKDRRPDDNQMVVGVLLDDNGRPISQPSFPGNTADIKTLLPVASSLKDRFFVKDITLVADRGMVSKKNKESLSEHGFPYILGVKMRSQKKEVKEMLSQASSFSEASKNLKVASLDFENKRYIICLNIKEKERDKLAREAILSFLEEKLKKGSSFLIGNSGFRRYLKMKEKPHIDWEKVKEEERYDGLWVLETTSDLPKEEIALRYKELWRVEKIFREAKSTLKTRPIYHKNDLTILGHVFISFLALALMHELNQRMNFSAEWEEIRQDLDALYEVEVKDDEKTWRLRSPLQGVAGKVFQGVGVAIPPSATLTKM